MSVVVVTLVGKPECHLCDTARDVVTSVIAEVEASALSSPGDSTKFVVEELSILDDPVLLARYSEEIPVVLIDGRVHTIWRAEAARLKAALLEAST